MKKVLLGTTALLGVSTLAGAAIASDGIKLEVGGFFRTAHQLNFDSGGEGDLGNDHATAGFFSDAEIHFKGETTLDNGLTVGARIELEGEQSGDQVDEAYVYFSGGFGEVRMGSDDQALASMCITPPGGTVNFGAFSPNEIAANTGGLISAATGGVISSNSVCTGVDSRGDAQKMVYFTPVWAGFQLGFSYTPNGGDETYSDLGGPHVGMPLNVAGEARNNTSAYVSYSYEGDGWGLTAGGGGAWQGHVEKAEGTDKSAADFYQTGLNLNFGAFSIGGAFEYYNDIAVNSENQHNNDAWVAGGGMSYNIDAWTVGLQYSYGHFEAVDENGDDDTIHQNRVALTGNYDMGPGISIDAEIAYDWTGGGTIQNSDGDLLKASGYDALEIGLGTAFTF